MTTLKELYPLVSEAIKIAEELVDEGKMSEAQQTYLRVSILEEKIAEILPATDLEGLIARDGAITASIQANDPSRTARLVQKYLGE